jgi:hypothetical protein
VTDEEVIQTTMRAVAECHDAIRDYPELVGLFRRYAVELKASGSDELWCVGHFFEGMTHQ